MIFEKLKATITSRKLDFCSFDYPFIFFPLYELGNLKFLWLICSQNACVIYPLNLLHHKDESRNAETNFLPANFAISNKTAYIKYKEKMRANKYVILESR